MLDPVQLTSEEISLLEQHFRKARNSLIRERAQAILAFGEGVSSYQLCTVLRRSEKTIREWIKAFHKERLASIFPHYQSENAAKLTHSQKGELKEILSNPPSEYGIPAKYWDISGLKSYIKAEFSVEYQSDESYRLLFLLHNYSFHLPDSFDKHRDDVKVEKRVEEIKEEIAPLMQDDRWVIFVCDECRIIWESEIRRLWLPKGQKTIIKVERKRKSQSFIGLLSLKSGEELLYRLSWQKQDEIIPVLEELSKKYPDKKICIIWDNARFHHGKKIKEKLSTSLRRIHLINLPAYAPDTNPQEHIWKYGKDKLANDQKDSLEETVQAFESIVTGRNYPYHF